MGVNVLTDSVPPKEETLFPATCIEAELGRLLDRVELLREITTAIIKWRKKLGEDEFIDAWEGALAFYGEQVQITSDYQGSQTGEMIGLGLDGSLILRKPDGNLEELQFGEIHLRPAL
jgi:biotin-(acetyl-CoA carboxylase) ligase